MIVFVHLPRQFTRSRLEHCLVQPLGVAHSMLPHLLRRQNDHCFLRLQLRCLLLLLASHRCCAGGAGGICTDSGYCGGSRIRRKRPRQETQVDLRARLNCSSQIILKIRLILLYLIFFILYNYTTPSPYILAISNSYHGS